MTAGFRLKLARWLTGLLVPVLVMLAAAPVAAAGTPRPDFGVRPAEEGQLPAPNGHFNYSLVPGSVVHDAIVVENLTVRQLSLQVFGADLIPLQGGGFGVGQLGEPQRGVGAWIKVSEPTITLSPHAQENVPFDVGVPKSVFSGDYGGAVVVQEAAPTDQGIVVEIRAALQVQVHVIGGVPHLLASVGPLHWRGSGKKVVFSATVTNTGNESLQFTGAVLLNKGHFRVLHMSPAGDYLFPGQHAVLTGVWDHPPLWGSVHAHASVTATSGVGASRTFVDRTAKLHFFPWWLVLMAILALLLLLAALVLAWRQRRQWRVRLSASLQKRRAVRAFKSHLEDGIDLAPSEDETVAP